MNLPRRSRPIIVFFLVLLSWGCAIRQRKKPEVVFPMFSPGKEIKNVGCKMGLAKDDPAVKKPFQYLDLYIFYSDGTFTATANALQRSAGKIYDVCNDFIARVTSRKKTQVGKTRREKRKSSKRSSGGRPQVIVGGLFFKSKSPTKAWCGA